MEAEKEVAEETKEEVMEEIEELKEEFGEDEVIENQDQQGERKGDGNPLETIVREEMYPGLSEDVIEKLHFPCSNLNFFSFVSENKNEVLSSFNESSKSKFHES